MAHSRSAAPHLERIRALRMRYREQHRCGMKALERHDFAALEAAIRGEREIIEEQMRLLEELRALGTARKDAPHVS